MDANTWWDCYEKLTTAYQKPKNTEQSKVYFEALGGWPNGVMVEAVKKLIRESKRWPNVAELRESAQSVVSGLTTPPQACDVCHGAGWVPAADEPHHGQTYTNYVTRCPQCRPSRSAAA